MSGSQSFGALSASAAVELMREIAVDYGFESTTMLTYFARHTSKLDIDEPTLRALWVAKKIGIHFPHSKTGRGERDSDSLDPNDYQGSARKAMNALRRLAASGGYVCAQYRGIEEVLVGVVEPNSEIELVNGKWGDRNGRSDRNAILKTLQLRRVKVIKPFDSVGILVGRPRQGTLMRWPGVSQVIANIVQGIKRDMCLSDLSPSQQEILCSEFLRLPEARQLGLPTLAHLLLPVGRTMKDIDIYGLASDGKRVFAQVTFSSDEQVLSKKMERLRKYQTPEAHVVLFCNADTTVVEYGVTIASIESVFARFQSSAVGKQWFSLALYRGDLTNS